MFKPWQKTPEDLALSAEYIDIWYCYINQHRARLDALYALLNKAECQRAARLKSNQHCQQFVITRGILRQYLAQLTNSDPQDLIIDYLEHGKPVLCQQQGNITFNISHAHDFALIAITKGSSVGIDIEKINQEIQMSALVARVFSVAEQQAFNNLPKTLQFQAFFACWTRKEAFLKAIGTGVAYGLKNVDVTVDPRQDMPTIKLQSSTDLWLARDLPVGQDYAACVVSNANDMRLRYWY